MVLRESVKSLLVRHPYTYGKIYLPRKKCDIFTNFEICHGKYSIELVDAEKRILEIKGISTEDLDKRRETWTPPPQGTTAAPP